MLVGTPSNQTAVNTFTVAWAASETTGTVVSRVRHAIRSLAAIGVRVTEGTLFVDSGSEYDLTCNLAGATRVEEIPVDQQPRIGGISDAGSVPITHHVWRVISICGRPRTIKFGYGDKISHHVIRCATMASHGIGTWFDPGDKQLYLVPGHANPRHSPDRRVCHQVGGLWAIPGALRGAEPRSTVLAPNPHSAMPKGGRDHVAATATVAPHMPVTPCVNSVCGAREPVGGIVSGATRLSNTTGEALIPMMLPTIPGVSLPPQPIWASPVGFPPPPPVPGYIRVVGYPGTPLVVQLTAPVMQMPGVATHVNSQQLQNCVTFHDRNAGSPAPTTDTQRSGGHTSGAGNPALGACGTVEVKPGQSATGAPPLGGGSQAAVIGDRTPALSAAALLAPRDRRHPRARFRTDSVSHSASGVAAAAATTMHVPAARAGPARVPHNATRSTHVPAAPRRSARPRRPKRKAPVATAVTSDPADAAAARTVARSPQTGARAGSTCSPETAAAIRRDPRAAADRVPPISPGALTPDATRAAATQIDLDGGEARDAAALRSAADATDGAAHTAGFQPQGSAVDYTSFRASMCNPSHEETVRIGKALGIRLINAARGRVRLDRARRTANARADPNRPLGDSGIFPRPTTVMVTDTTGSSRSFPLSALGNNTMQTWSIVGEPDHIYVTFAKDGTAQSSWDGFEQVCREACINVQRDAISQNIRLLHDNGSEYMSVFLENCVRAGILQNTSTAYKEKKGAVAIAETNNAIVQQYMRSNLVLSRRNFHAFGLDERLYWDRAARYGMVQRAVRKAAQRRGKDAPGVVPETALAHAQVRRHCPSSFGAYGQVTLQPKDPRRSHEDGSNKQTADRCVGGLLLGVTAGRKCIMLLEDGRTTITSDVHFLPDTAVPDSSGANVAADPSRYDHFSTEPDTRDTVGAPGPSEVAPHFTGTDGSCIVVGSRVAVTWIGEGGKEFDGTVTSIDLWPGHEEGGEYRVDYDAGGHNFHAVKGSDAFPTRVKAPVDAAVLAAVDQAILRIERSDRCRQPSSDVGNVFESPHPVGLLLTMLSLTLASMGESEPDRSSDAIGPSFVGADGEIITAGSHVSVTQHGGVTVEGIVTGVDLAARRGGLFWVAHADDTNECYPIRPGRPPTRRRRRAGDAASSSVDVRLTLHARRVEPHADVLQYLTAEGDILPELLDGSVALPPAPDLPHIPHIGGPTAPTTVHGALSGEHALLWLYSILTEYHGHVIPAKRPPTFHYTTERNAGKQLHCKWVFVFKRHGNGKLIKLKSRMVVAGWWLERGVHYAESYSGMGPWSDIMDIECAAVNFRLQCYEADLSSAYPFATMPPAPNGDPVIAISTPGVRVFRDGRPLNLGVDQAWYGHPASGFALARLMHNKFLNRDMKPGDVPCPVPFVQCPYQPVLFKADFPLGHEHHGEIFWLHIATDNIRTYTSIPAMQQTFMDWLDITFNTTGGRMPLQGHSPETYMGCLFTYDHSGVTISMQGFIANLLHDTGMTDANAVRNPLADKFTLSRKDEPQSDADRHEVVAHVNRQFNTDYSTYAEVVVFYAYLISSFGWISGKVSPSTMVHHSILGRALQNPSIKAFTGAKRFLRWLAGRPNLSRRFERNREWDWRNGDLPEWFIQSDSSYADDAHDRKSQGGYVGGFRDQAVTTAVSGKTHRVATSTYQAEAAWASKAAKQAEYTRNVHQFLGILRPEPTVLEVDNYATYINAGAPIVRWSASSKQHDIEERYVVECVQDKKISLRHRSGSLPPRPKPADGFTADGTTKCLGGPMFEHYFHHFQGPQHSSSTPTGRELQETK